MLGQDSLSAMDTDRRHRYLQRLGVDQWYARKRLSGAFKTPESLLVSPDSTATVATDSSGLRSLLKSPQDQTSRVNPLGGAMSDDRVSNDQSVGERSVTSEVVAPNARSMLLDSDQDGAPRMASVSEVAESEVAESEVTTSRPKSGLIEQPRIHLRVYSFEAFVVTSLAESPVPDPREATLAANIIQAVARSVPSLALSECFTWPVFSHAAIHQSLDVGFEQAFTLWIDRLSSHLGVRAHLHFGDMGDSAAAKLLLEDGRIWRAPTQFVFGYALHQLISNPALKAQCWRALTHSPVFTHSR